MEKRTKIKWNYDMVKSYISEQGDALLSKEYKNNHTKLDIQCAFNHIFHMTFHDYKDGNCRCGQCYKEEREVSKEEVVNYLQKYGYELISEYKNTQEKIRIKCPNGHITEMAFCQFKSNGHRCKYCVNKNIRLDYTFVKNAFEEAGYMLNETEYINNTYKMNVTCPCGHHIRMSWTLFQMGVRCNECNSSSGELEIANYLNSHNIYYIGQYAFDDCKDTKVLPFDFYIPSKNTIIEFDGEQHFKPIKLFGGEKAFLTRKRHDNIKNNYCKRNNITLIRIPYFDFNNISIILNNELSK